MRIYICARNMHHEETAKIAAFLEKHDHIVYYAAKDTYQNAPADEIFLNNLVLIRNTDARARTSQAHPYNPWTH